jgi:hypothetical protein
MKKLVKVIIAILVVAAICFGIYTVLPETTQMYVKGNIQYRTDDTAKSHVDEIKGLIAEDSVTYGTGLEKLCKSTAWYYEPGSDSENWTVTFYGSKATMDFTSDNISGVGLYTEKPLKVVFSVRTGGQVDITITIGGDTLSDDAKTAAKHKIAKAGK